jgi:gas vesicle protein
MFSFGCNLISNKKFMTTGKALLGVLAGIAAGTIIGILLAPDKGSRLKKSIGKKGEDLAEAINATIDDKFEELLKSISSKVNKSKNQEEAFNGPEV